MPKTIVARKGLTRLIHPSYALPRNQKRVRRLTEYSFSFSSVSCMKDSFSTLNTSSSRSVFSRRDIHSPAMSRQIYPAVRVAIYSTVSAGSGRGRASNHQLPKKSSKPDTPQRMILRHVIFCSFTPFVPRQLRARNSTAKSFVQRILENSPAVRWKPSNILSTTPMSMPHSRTDW